MKPEPPPEEDREDFEGSVGRERARRIGEGTFLGIVMCVCCSGFISFRFQLFAVV